ncbi:MAG: type II toxin-antitoxin system death-on-curing family toxin [Nitrospira sp.]|nr:type II toxin-antitoxin system death-on-curing family toxin [Nitrospira sp.]
MQPTSATSLRRSIIERWGGADRIRDLDALESALAQPHQNFGGQSLYLDLTSKAAALCFALVLNHPFVYGNKRIGHAEMETFLIINGSELDAPIDAQEHVMLDLAVGNLSREEFVEWVTQHTTLHYKIVSPSSGNITPRPIALVHRSFAPFLVWPYAAGGLDQTSSGVHLA